MNENDFKKFLEDSSWDYDKKTIEQMMESELQKEPEDINTEFIDACIEHLTSYSENAAPKKDKVIDKKKLTHKRISFRKILVVAAIAAVLMVTVNAFANPSSRKYVIAKFSDHSSYKVCDVADSPKVKSLTVGYMPEGFKKTEEYTDDLSFNYNYENDKGAIVMIDKMNLGTHINFNTERYGSKIIKINGIDAVYYRADVNCNSVIFNDGEYIYSVDGVNVSKEEVIKIAQNIK